MQRGLITSGGVPEAGIRPRPDQQVNQLRAVGEVPRPVGDHVKQGPAAFAVPDHGAGQRRVRRQEPPDRPGIAAADGKHQLNGPRVIVRDLQHPRLVAHEHHHHPRL